MKVIVKKGYTDRILRRNVREGEELTVSEPRAQQLVEKGLAEIVVENADALKSRIAELEALVEEKDKRIAELEALVEEKDKRIAELEAAAKKAAK